jgi:hypothetical protein
MSDSAVVQSIIFGFGHRARSGKDTVAQFINMYRGMQSAEPRYDIRIYSFAGELKREINENAEKSGGMIRLFDDGLRMEGTGYWQTNGNIMPLPDWVQYDPHAPMDDPLCPYGKQRTLLQWWGTEFRRSINPDYWVQRLTKRLAEEKPEIALITDVRFLNEVQFCQKYGEAIRIVRPGLIRDTSLTPAHISESALANFHGWDDVIVNDSTLESLRARALFSFDMLMSAIPSTRLTPEGTLPG